MQPPTEPRRFGSTSPSATPQRAFSTATEPAAPRRFGAPAGDTGHFGRADAAFGHGGPIRSTAGHPYMYQGHSFAPFRAEHYAWPHGYHYRTYVVGAALPRVFWVHQYFVTNYVDYGVAPPDPGFQWVRYGPDLLLIDLASGQVANVVPGVFDESAGAQDAAADQSQAMEQPQ